MGGLTADKMTNLYADLTSQISSSVKNIKHKSEQGFALPKDKAALQTSNEINKSSFTGYTFSYLEPSSLYNIHQVKSSLNTEEELQEHSGRKNQILENEEQSQSAENDNLEKLDSASFVEELQNTFALDAKSITKIYQNNALNKPSAAPLMLNGNNFAMHDVKYANDTYNFTFNINKTPDVRIEYLHKNNQSFDYRI